MTRRAVIECPVLHQLYVRANFAHRNTSQLLRETQYHISTIAELGVNRLCGVTPVE